MPFLTRPCGNRIYYEVVGKGIPILLLAPGGMRSSIPFWGRSPYNPWTTLPRSKFMLIGMDQRFAGRSTGTVREQDNWDTFLEDQIALLDSLKVQRCHIVCSCIGPSYAFNLLRQFPHRFGRCVMLQPIGLSPHTAEPDVKWEGLNTEATWAWAGDWARERVESGEYADTETMATLENLHERMFKSGREFVFSIGRYQATRIRTPLMVFMGRDMSHPQEVAREICRLCPTAELVPIWRNAGEEKLQEAASKIDSFLSSPP